MTMKKPLSSGGASPAVKNNLHPRSRHRGRYDFPALCAALPELNEFVRRNEWGDLSVDFADPQAVICLNRALLSQHYNVAHWQIPPGALCPPVPGRADYIHYLADLLAADAQNVIPRGPQVSVLDIGTGASCIYPLIGQAEYGWRFTGTETEPASVKAAAAIVSANPGLSTAIRLRTQPDPLHIFRGVIKKGERYTATLCNPPFHASEQQAGEGAQRKRRNLGLEDKPALNFGGTAGELWCEGGETGFITRMIKESAEFASQVNWFTSLVSRKENLKPLYQALRDADAREVKTVEMAQGQKVSRFIAWTFLPAEKRK